MNQSMKDIKVVITGMGAICSLGGNRQRIFESVSQGLCGIRKVQAFDLSKLGTQLGGEVADGVFDFPKEITDRTSQLAYVAMQEAMKDSGLDLEKEDPYRCALSLGTCNGNILTLEKVYENNFINTEQLSSVYQKNFLAIDYLNKALNIRGAKVIFVTACSASNNAIGYAYDLIRTNQADVVFVGGADSLARTTFSGFHSLQSLSPEPSVPFSQKIGLSLGEGAAFMVMESEDHAYQRKAVIHGQVMGYGFCGDAYHATSPDITGDGAMRAMQAAVESAGIKKQDIAFVCAHGTGTMANDKTESLAIKKYFGSYSQKMYISSTKSMHGHALGAAGILQAVISIDCMNHKLIPALVNFTDFREDCDLNYVINKPLECEYHCFLSNSFAFGGNNVSVVFGKTDRAVQESLVPLTAQQKIVITGMGACTALSQKIPLADLLRTNDCLAQERVMCFDDFMLSNPKFKKFRKAPRISQFAIQAIEDALKDANYEIKDGAKIAIAWGVAKGPLRTFEKYYQGVMQDGLEFASALSFPHIVQNSTAGQASIAFGIKGCNTTVAGQFSPFAALHYAAHLIEQGKNEIFVVGGADEISQFDFNMMREDCYRKDHLSEGSAALIIESQEHALRRKANVYAEIEGFSITSSAYDQDVRESYRQCIGNTLRMAHLNENDIDLHIVGQAGCPLPRINELANIKMVTSSQHIVGTLESATAILNTMLGVVALESGFAPRQDMKNELYREDFRKVLVSAAANNGTYYSFILKKPGI